MFDTEALYEQTKRVLRRVAEDNGFSTDGRFIMACHECGLPFPQNAEMGMIADHTKVAHNQDKPMLDLIYIGEGPPPKPKA